MFNRIDNHYHTYNSTTVEKRAPTDESVKILRELELAAEKKVEATFRLDSNSLKALIHRQDDMLNCHKVFLVRYELNGIRSSVEVRIDMDYPSEVKKSRDSIAMSIRDAVAKDIASKALESAFKELTKMELDACLK